MRLRKLLHQILLLHYKKNINTKGEYLNIIHKDSTDNTNTANTVNTTKSNSHNNQTQNANTESYSNLMNNTEYFSVFGFLLAGLANYMLHEKLMSD